MVNHEASAIRVPLGVEAEEKLRPFQCRAIGSFHDKTLDIMISRQPKLSIFRSFKRKACFALGELGIKGRRRCTTKSKQCSFKEIRRQSMVSLVFGNLADLDQEGDMVG